MSKARDIADLGSNDVLETTSTGVDVTGDLKFNSGYGSAATAYGCRAWVNFNGTGTAAIRESGNVSSITDIGTGAFNLNFTTALADSNYAVSLGGRLSSAGYTLLGRLSTPFSTTTLRTYWVDTSDTPQDGYTCTVMVVR